MIFRLSGPAAWMTGIMFYLVILMGVSLGASVGFAADSMDEADREIENASAELEETFDEDLEDEPKFVQRIANRMAAVSMFAADEAAATTYANQDEWNEKAVMNLISIAAVLPFILFSAKLYLDIRRRQKR